MQKIEIELAELMLRATLIDTERTAAQAALETAVAARQRMIQTGDISDTKARLALQAKVDTAISALAGFDTAATDQAVLVANAKARLAAERRQAAQEAAADELSAQKATVDRLLGPWLLASRNLASALEAIHWRFESTQMGAFIRNAAGEIENAAAMTTSDLDHSIKAIRDGHQDIPRAPATTVVPVPAVTAEAVPPTSAPPPLFHRVDRPSYQMRYTAEGAS